MSILAYDVYCNGGMQHLFQQVCHCRLTWGEDYVTVKMPVASSAPLNLSAPLNSNSNPAAETSVSDNAPPHQQPLPCIQTPEPKDNTQPAPCEPHTQRPSKKVQDILTGIGVTLN